MRLQIEMLGPFRATSEGVPVRISGRKGLALLVYMARRGGAVPRETLMALLWPDSGDGQARASLRQTLSALRRDLGRAATAALLAEDQSVALASSVAAADTEQFERLARSADLDDLEAAQGLWRGDFAEGMGAVSPEFGRWVEAERGALRARFEALLMRLCDGQSASGRTEAMIATALRLLALDPLQEQVHRRVIGAYRKQRRFDAALRQFEVLKSVLWDQLGVAPEPETLALIREIRRERGAGGAVPSTGVAAVDLTARSSPASRPSMAVLPFTGAPEGSDAALLGEGIAEEVIVNLSRDPALLVVSRQSSFHPDITRAASAEIGARLGVRFVLSGSVRVAGGRIRVMAQLARCEDGAGIWAETYDREIGDIFTLQSEIARTVMATAAGRMVDAEGRSGRKVLVGNLDAWRLVLLGLRELHEHTPDSMRAAIDYLARAEALAPENGRALGLLALARIYARWNYAAQTDVSDILPLAERALALDRHDSRAHCAMAVACLLARDHDRAGQHFEAGLAANPNDDLLLIEYGRYLLYVDRPEDALQRVREAMRLNPLHPDWFWNIQGRCLHLLGRHAEALAAFRRIAAPVFYHFAYMAACHRALGDDTAAETMRARLLAAAPDFDLDRFLSALPHRSAATAHRFAREFDWLREQSDRVETSGSK